MNNHELSQMPIWRYTEVVNGTKKPTPANWQNTPKTLDQITTNNIGLMLGPHSQGVMALDFDGISAWSWYDATIGGTLPDTVTWTSGKEGRCQMAFSVPEEYWDVLSTKKITHAKSELIAEGEGFEFRWSGGQSVLPPSIHPDLGAPYYWLRSPVEVGVAEIPEAVLCYWLTICNPINTIDPDYEEPDMSSITEERFNEVDSLLQRLKAKHTTLPYDDWRTVSWAVAKHLGRDIGIQLLLQYYPEKVANEYRDLFKSYNAAKSPGIGSIVFLAGISPRSKAEEQINKLKRKIQQWQ